MIEVVNLLLTNAMMLLLMRMVLKMTSLMIERL
jgi:hypothetical protein